MLAQASSACVYHWEACSFHCAGKICYIKTKPNSDLPELGFVLIYPVQFSSSPTPLFQKKLALFETFE